VSSDLLDEKITWDNETQDVPTDAEAAGMTSKENRKGIEPSAIAPGQAPLPPVIRKRYNAAGNHQCQSQHNIGHTCQVQGFDYSDCNEAMIKLKMDDCCRRTQVCGPDYQTGKIKCELGGTSIGFTPGYCY